MNPQLPHPLGDRYNFAWAQRLVDALQAAFTRVLSTETASPFAMLVAPDQGVWKVTVSNTGVLTTVKLPKGTPL
jgi:hypothetical protein